MNTPAPHERGRRSVVSGIAAAGARAAQVLATLFAVPRVLEAVGPDRYGLYATVIGLSVLSAFADFGLGNGLVTALARATAEDDRPRARALVSSAAFALLAVAALLGLLLAALGTAVPWGAVFAVQGPAAAEAQGAALWFGALFCTSIPLSLVARVHLGLQEGHVAACFQGAGSLLGLGAVLWAISMAAPTALLVAAWQAGPLAAALANAIYLFAVRQNWLWPRPGDMGRATLTELWRLGALFFTLQLAVGVAFGSDNLVLAHVVGPAAVAPYSVHAQPFTWILGLANVFLMPLWPAYGDAIARGDRPWVAATLLRSLLLSAVVCGALGALLAFTGPSLLSVWVKGTVQIDRGLLLALAAWTLASALGSALSMLLNAAGVVGFQVGTAVAMTVAVLVARIAGANATGPAGMVWATLAAYALFSLAPTAVYVRRWLKRP